MLSLENVTAGYGRIVVVRDVSVRIGTRDLVCLIGRNGAGKTTLMRAITGFVRCNTGRIEFDGRDITNLAPHRIVPLGINQVAEGRQLFYPLSVYENLILGTYYKRREMDKRKIGELCQLVFDLFPILAERSKQLAGTLSGGEQQMLAIGRALMSQPRLLLLDEPSLGLAPLVVEEIATAIQRLNRDGLGILLVEQNAALALGISEKAYVMDVGQIVMSGRSAEMVEDPRVREAFLG